SKEARLRVPRKRRHGLMDGGFERRAIDTWGGHDIDGHDLAAHGIFAAIAMCRRHARDGLDDLFDGERMHLDAADVDDFGFAADEMDAVAADFDEVAGGPPTVFDRRFAEIS